MDYNDDDADSPPNPYTISRRKEKVENAPYNHIIGNSHVEYDINDDSEEDINIEDDDDDDGGNGVQRISKYDYEDGVDEDDDDYGDLPKHPKKRKLKTLLASYEFAPRVPPPSKPSQGPGGRNPLTDWTEHGTFILLDAWGDRFVKQGKKSLRSEEWQEVAEKVSQESKMERTDTQCRNRLDTLKKKYKKEKMRFGESSGCLSEWVYFKKMDMLLSSSSLPQKTGLSCGVDSGEYVFTNPKVYLNRSNVLDEMRDSPENSGNESEGLPPKKILPPKKTKNVKVRRNGDSIKLLADSIKKFSSVYEKTEKNMRHDLVELEKLRMELHRDLELQKKQILEKAQAEIIKIRRGIVKDNDVPADE